MMTFPTTASVTTDLSVPAVIERLARRENVDGVVLLGSTTLAQMEAHSDVDVLVVLSSASSLRGAAAVTPFEVVYTWIAGRPADVIITTLAELSFSTEVVEPIAHQRDALRGWLTEGTVVYDRNGRLDAKIRRLRTAMSSPWTEAERWALWWRANFAAEKARRYARAHSPAYRDAVEWIVYQGMIAALVGYFAARRLPWRGERAALDYWTRNDDGFRSAVAEVFAADRRSVVDRYDEVVEAALGPVGGRWPEGSGPSSETWQSLIDESEGES